MDREWTNDKGGGKGRGEGGGRIGESEELGRPSLSGNAKQVNNLDDRYAAVFNYGSDLLRIYYRPIDRQLSNFNSRITRSDLLYTRFYTEDPSAGIGAASSFSDLRHAGENTMSASCYVRCVLSGVASLGYNLVASLQRDRWTLIQFVRA
jgi:hypothetical protein